MVARTHLNQKSQRPLLTSKSTKQVFSFWANFREKMCWLLELQEE